MTGLQPILKPILHNSQKSSANYDWTMTDTSQFSEIMNDWPSREEFLPGMTER